MAPRSIRLGQVACAQCWEYVIRCDERLAVEFELPPLSGDDALIVDPIAVELAICGEQVHLTLLEKAEAVTRMAADGRTKNEVARRLRMSGATVTALWPTPAATAGGQGTA